MASAKGVIEFAWTADRRVQVWLAALQREFLPPAAFKHQYMDDRSREPIDIRVKAPWF